MTVFLKGNGIKLLKLNSPLSIQEIYQNRPPEVNDENICKYYDKCLSQAAMRNWPSFSCRFCPMFKTFPIDEILMLRFGT
jgi:hypothetical protein